jgi:dynactin complex subunit
VGQRQSYDGALCTVRYVGAVRTTKGEWLGVEWDDGQRGKHSGEHEGKRYFDCVYSQLLRIRYPRSFSIGEQFWLLDGVLGSCY